MIAKYFYKKTSWKKLKEALVAKICCLYVCGQNNAMDDKYILSMSALWRHRELLDISVSSYNKIIHC